MTPKEKPVPKSQLKRFAKIEEDIKKQAEAVKTTIAAAVTPIRDLPKLVQALEKEGRAEDATRVLELGKSVAADVDQILAEKKKIDDEFKALQEETRTRRIRNAGLHHMSHLGVGSNYILLNQRAINTAVQTAADIEEIINSKQEESND